MVQQEVAIIVEPAGLFLSIVRGTDLDGLPWVPDHRVMAFLKPVLDRP